MHTLFAAGWQGAATRLQKDLLLLFLKEAVDVAIPAVCICIHACFFPAAGSKLQRVRIKSSRVDALRCEEPIHLCVRSCCLLGTSRKSASLCFNLMQTSSNRWQLRIVMDGSLQGL